MKVAFRAEASVQIGAGHVMRCLALADALLGSGMATLFICQEVQGNLGDLIGRHGHEVRLIPPSGLGPNSRAAWEDDAAATTPILDAWEPDWLVIDHYGIDAGWESRVSRHVRRIMVIDDLADRPHDCDLLLDQSDFSACPERYTGLVPEDCRLFVGPEYALLRREFFNPALRRERDGCVRRILVFFGGTDPTSETSKALEALAIHTLPVEIDVVIGEANPAREAVVASCSRLDLVPTIQADDMAVRMASADLALGSCGVASLERCALHLPTLAIIVAENQRETARHLATLGAIESLGWHSEVDARRIAGALQDMCSDPERIRRMSSRCAGLVKNGTETVMYQLRQGMK